MIVELSAHRLAPRAISDMQGRRYSIFVIIADSVAISHFIVCNLAFVMGEFTDVFAEMRAANPGLEFVYRYVDYPVFYVFRHLVDSSYGDMVLTVLIAQFVIVMSSVIYGIIAGLVIKTLVLMVQI